MFSCYLAEQKLNVGGREKWLPYSWTGRFPKEFTILDRPLTLQDLIEEGRAHKSCFVDFLNALNMGPCKWLM